MAALETRDRHAVAGHAVRVLLRRVQRAVKAHAARTGHGEHALLLGVEVQELLALQVRAVQRERAVHADLFIDGEDRLDGGMGERFVREDREDHRNGDSVVAAERGLVRPDPFAVGADIESVAHHVLGTVLGLGADHVDMAL